MLITRAYRLKLEGNKGKLESVRYSASKYTKYVQHFLTQLYYNRNIKFLSTESMGGLANRAQHKAIGILRANKESIKATGNKSNCPQFKKLCVPANIEISKASSFNFWVSVEDSFSKKRIKIPSKSYKAINKKLRQGWSLNSVGEAYLDNNDNKWYAIVFVQKEVAKATPYRQVLGCDVGYKYSVSRSDGHIGKKLTQIIATLKRKRAERQRQGFKKISVKTQIKQLLDIEAKNAVNASRNSKRSLVIESPKVIANLSSGKLQGWARSYFAHRCHTLGQENGVFIWEVNPAYTSITCSKCGVTDKQSRVNRDKFICTSCKSEKHADINAACNIALKGAANIRGRK